MTSLCVWVVPKSVKERGGGGGGGGGSDEGLIVREE